ncbi:MULTISPECIES: hypothetical protein [Paenibacillus]|uniref:hypothetical protein n=1 Tax=Paenibacillus TaxID=44249 RepID=UPI0008FCCC5F|nr:MULTISPECIES: hypothetical protein [Paenibacillus]
MDSYLPDSSGIYSLSGFSFQIRVFVYYMLMLEAGSQIEFETIDDVNIKKIKADEIDDYDENFHNRIVEINFNRAIQVKRTSITESNAQKILLNWILLESSDNEISQFVLFTDDEYGNKDILFDRSAKEHFELIKESKKNSKAIITKVKKIYKDDFGEFEKTYNSIKEKYSFISEENINEKIRKNCSTIFRRAGINKVVFSQRINELLQHVTVQIMNTINDKKPYILNYTEFMKIVEGISSRITEEITLPLYADFKKIYKIDFNDMNLSNSREYKQLLACELNTRLLEQHLTYCAYYNNLRFSYMESNKIGKIEDIEVTTYENFEDSKFRLQRQGCDEAYNRLEETKKMGNSHAANEQIRYGSGIYLTKDGIDDFQISWEDQDNEQTKA